MSRKHVVLIAGAGGMGSAVGLLLRELGDFEVDLFIGDADLRRAEAAASWIRDGSTRKGAVEPFLLPPSGSSPRFQQALETFLTSSHS